MFATLEVAKAFVVFSDSTALEVVQLMNCTFIVKLALSLFLLDNRSLYCLHGFIDGLITYAGKAQKFRIHVHM